MIIDEPKNSHAPALRALFADAFGDSERFLDLFFSIGFSPSRARVALEGDELLASLYWFDCECDGRRVAYVYAIATARAHRGRGICRALMTDAHRHLAHLGYSTAMLVPAEPSLFDFYSKLGYRKACGLEEIEAVASESPLPLREISAEEYASVRRRYLPRGAVNEDGAIIRLLSATSKLYTGEGVLLSARKSGSRLIATELLGNTDAAPDILSALDCKSGIFRTPGGSLDFAMYLPLTEDSHEPPSYFGIALDI